MEPFTIGDIIIPKDKTPYSSTDGKGTVLRVASLRTDHKDSICVEIIEHRDRSELGSTYWVNPMYFDFKDRTPDDVFLNSL